MRNRAVFFSRMGATIMGGSFLNLLARHILICAAIFTLAVEHFAQSRNDQNQSNRSVNQQAENPSITRWRILLSSLAQEARTAFPESRRAYAMVEVANANWRLDRETSRQLYVTALDNAVIQAREDKQNRHLINYVLAAATGQDTALAKELNKRLVDSDDSGNDVSIETATDLIEENPLAAAQLAEAFAPGGLSDGTAAFLIFSIARKDVTLSDKVYGVYLNKVIANNGVELNSVMTLAGYGLGYSEYYTVGRSGDLTGASFVPIAGLSLKPTLVTGFLDLAYRRLAATIARRDRAVGAEIERLNFSILFSTEYLMPEIAKVAPEQLPRWRILQQRGIVGVTSEQSRRIQNHILQIQQARLRTTKFSDGSQSPELEAEKSLEDVDKIPGTCRRDVIRSNAALLFASRKNFKRATEIAEAIEDLKQEEMVKQAILISEVESAIENGEVDEAEARSEKVSSPEHKARLYIMLADSVIGKGERQRSRELVNRAGRLVEKVADSGIRAAMLFSLASIIEKLDSAEAASLFRDAISHLNKKGAVDEPKFSLPIKVPLSCSGEEEAWYGGFETLPNSNVFDALATFAKENPNDAERAIEDIGDKITRIRAQSLIAQLALDELINKSSTRRH